MAKKLGIKLVNFVAWLTGVLVSLAVAFAMTAGTLTIPYIPDMVTVVAGWIVVVTTVLSVVLAIFNK